MISLKLRSDLDSLLLYERTQEIFIVTHHLASSPLSNHFSLLSQLLFPNVSSLSAAKGSCGNGIQLSAGQADLKLDGKTFRNKPIDGVTLALWINVTSVKGKHYLFDTIGGHSAHKHDQYLLIINNGAITWSHNDENDKQLFTVTTDPIVIESTYIVFVMVSFLNAFYLKKERAS